MSTKQMLKEIREAIKTEKFSEAITKSQELLKTEPENHMIYLLLGAAYQSTNRTEAVKCLRKAVEYSPGAPTMALQGLANCAPAEELPKVLEQLIELLPEKRVDYLLKLFNLADNGNVALACFEVFKRLLPIMEGVQSDIVMKYLIRIWLRRNYDVTENNEQLFQAALECAIKDTQLDVYLTASKRYIKLLFKQNNLEACVQKAAEIVEQYPEDVYAYDWLCKIYCDYLATHNQMPWWQALKSKILTYADKLLALNSESGLAILVQALHNFEQQQFVLVRSQLKKVLQIQPQHKVAVELLARTEMELNAYELAAEHWQQLAKIDTLEYAICLSHAADELQCGEALNLLQKMNDSAIVNQSKARCLHKLNQQKELSALALDDLSKAEYLMSPAAALEFIKSSTAIDLEAFDTLLMLGKLQLQMSNYAESLVHMLKATRLLPHRAECFLYLGKIYFGNNDMIRAKKCFEKCIHLNPLCEEAVSNLSAIYQQLGEEELNVALLLNTLQHMKSEINAKRLNYKLGLHYLYVNKYDEAIQSFRAAIKADVSCMVYWESLGDAYAARGSYNSAIRVFQKIIELDASNIYAKLQIANINTTIRKYVEAIDDFDKLLLLHPNYLPGLKGAAEAHIGLANNLIIDHCYGRAKAHYQLAINHLQSAFLNSENSNMLWLWRLTAVVFLQTAQMPTSLANLDVSGKLAKRDTEMAFLNRKDLLNLSTRFLTCALKIKQNTYLWYELALSCYYSAHYLPEDAAAQLDLAIKACKMAIQEDSSRWQNWNLLGVLHMNEAINNLSLAQHCFIQALNIDRKSYTTWTNLGALYLKLHEIKLANQAFQRAQQSSPIFGNAWIGQAMIAEAISEEEEAMDLFRHCQQFDYHKESAIGYAHWVCHILTNETKSAMPHYKHAVEHMYADVVAMDAINWYVANEEADACVAGLSFQAFLNLRQNLCRPALKAYQQAVQKLSTGFERDQLLTNMGYLYLRLKQPHEAINAFNAVTEVSFKPIIGLALAYFRAGQHQESYSVYNSVLPSVAGKEDDKAARILVAMASMVYASQGEADTKTILYQCILLKNYPIEALFSACALGILHQDNQLSETILMELKKYQNLEKHCAHIAFLNAQYHLANNQPRRALVYLISRVHIFPQCAELRTVLAKFLLEHYSNHRQYQLATSQMALSAIDLAHRSKSKKSDCIEVAKSLLIASQALKPIDANRSRKLIQKAIHLHPENKSAWQALKAF